MSHHSNTSYTVPHSRRGERQLRQMSRLRYTTPPKMGRGRLRQNLIFQTTWNHVMIFMSFHHTYSSALGRGCSSESWSARAFSDKVSAAWLRLVNAQHSKARDVRAAWAPGQGTGPWRYREVSGQATLPSPSHRPCLEEAAPFSNLHKVITRASSLTFSKDDCSSPIHIS